MLFILTAAKQIHFYVLTSDRRSIESTVVCCFDIKTNIVLLGLTGF